MCSLRLLSRARKSPFDLLTFAVAFLVIANTCFAIQEKDRSFPIEILSGGFGQTAKEVAADPKAKERLTRPLTEKEQNIFRQDKYRNRVLFRSLRRADNKGQVRQKLLTKARARKMETFGASSMINSAPVGPGCNWLSVGPRNINGRIKCLAIDPTNGQVIYAGAADGGVWKTEDGGQSWAATMHEEDSLAIGSIAIDPSDSNIVYAGTGEPVYLFSGSGPLPPGSSNLAWYYAGAGVYRSNDGGTTWNVTGPIENEFIYRVAVDPNDSNHLLCAGFALDATQGGLCQSTDGGASWTTIVNGVFTDVLFDPNNAGIAYAAQYNQGIFKSIDSGVTWNTRNTGLPAINQIGRVNLTIAASNSNVLYAKVESDSTGGHLGTYRTDSAAEAPGGWTAVSNPSVDGTFLWWCSHIAADPTDATGQTVWASGVSVARSDDGGATWDAVTDEYGSTQPTTHPDQHTLVFDPSNSNRVFIGNDGGVFRGDYTGGATPVDWKKVSTGLVVTQFYDLHASPASRSMFGGGTQDNGSMISTGGQSWRHVFGGDGGYVAFHPTDPYTVYVQWQNANIQRSTDGGNSFLSARNGITGTGIFPATVMAIDSSNPLTLFAGTNRVFRTTNGGVGISAWSPSSPVIGAVTEVQIAPSSSSVIYAGTLNGTLHRATDGGATSSSFNDITPRVAGWPTRWLSGVAIDPANSDRIYVSFLGFNNTGLSDHVWRGQFDPVDGWDWTQISAGLPDVPVGGIVFHPGSGDLYIATDVGVFRSQNDGVTWAPFERGLPNTAVVDLHLDSTRNLLRAATHGRGMYQFDLSGRCPDVDIYLRDNILDTGEVFPSPSGVPDPTQTGVTVRHYKSADILVDASPFDAVDALLDGVEFDDPVHPYIQPGSGARIESIDGLTHNQPIRDQVNRVYVQVHNRGWDTSTPVTVKLMYADAGAGLPALPSDFWSNFPGDGFDQTHWKPIGTQTVNNLLPNTPQVVQFDWTPPSTTSNHVCLLAMVDAVSDPLTPETELNVDLLTRSNKRVTHRNTHPINAPAPGGGPAWTKLDFHNAFKEAKLFQIRLEGSRRSRSRIRMILPDIRLRRDILDSVKGFKVSKLDRKRLVPMIEFALKQNSISESTAKKLLELKSGWILESTGEVDDSILDGVVIHPKEHAFAVLLIDVDPELRRPFHFEVTQWLEKQLVGGSEYILYPQRQDKSRDDIRRELKDLRRRLNELILKMEDR